MPALQRIVAKALASGAVCADAAMPLIGWAMLSAAGYPVTLFGALHLPPIVPHNVELYALLRALHTWLAFALFLTVLGISRPRCFMV